MFGLLLLAGAYIGAPTLIAGLAINGVATVDKKVDEDLQKKTSEAFFQGATKTFCKDADASAEKTLSLLKILDNESKIAALKKRIAKLEKEIG